MINIQSPDFSDLPLSSTRPYGAFYERPNLIEPPVVSILTPFFNTDDVFLETVEAIFGQSLQAWEWIIVDDGSTSTEALQRLDSIAARDPRVKIFRQENAGPAAARNKAFLKSSGRYLCLIDSDDLIEPTYIEKCIWFLESQTAFGFCNSYSVIFGSEQYLWTTGFEQGRNYLHANSGPPISVLRRQTFSVAGGFDETITFGHEDWDFWLRIASQGVWGYTIPEYLQWYRKRSSGRFHQVMSDPAVHADFERLINERYSKLIDCFPAPKLREASPYEDIDFSRPFDNPVSAVHAAGSALFLFPWMVTGGADRVNLDWISALREAEWKVSVCATLDSHHNWQHEFARLTPDIFVLNRFLHRTDTVRFIEYLILSRNVDIVIVSASTLGYFLLPCLRSRFPNVAFVDLCHVEEPLWLNGGHPRFGAGYQGSLDLNLVTTRHLKDWMVTRGADPARVEVCYTGADLPERCATEEEKTEIRTIFGVTEGTFLIVFAGRLADQKRPLLLLDILASLNEQQYQFECLIVGDGELRKSVEDRCTSLGVRERVKLLGSLPHAEWLQLLEIANLLLMPSAYEGISVALFEAMARGVVPVVGNVGGQGEVVTAGCGTLIEPLGDERVAYTEAVSRYITNRALWLEVSTNARRRTAEHFPKKSGSASFIALLMQAISMNVEQPQPRLPITLAREFAVLALEYLRMSALADYLWAKRDPRRYENPMAAIGGQPMAPPRKPLTRALLRLRASRPGRLLARAGLLRRLGRRIADWLERKPGF